MAAGMPRPSAAFELEGALLAANWYFHLYADPGYLSRGRRARPGPPCQRSYPCWQVRLRPGPQTGETRAAGDRATQRE
jgi:hypothetical protein